MIIYRLRHIYDNSEYDLPDPMTLGYFSNVDILNEAVEYYRTLAGFVDYPNGFIAEECDVKCNEIPNTVFEAYFVFEDYEGIYNHSGEIGVFITENDANNAIQNYKKINNNYILNSVLKKEIDVYEYTINEKYMLDAFSD